MVGTNLAGKLGLGGLGSFKSNNNLGGDGGETIPNTQRSGIGGFQPKTSMTLGLGGGVGSSLANLGGISAGLSTNREYQTNNNNDKSF